MPAGLQVWDANGVLVLDITDSLAKTIGTITTQHQVAGSITVPDVEGGTRAFVVKRAAPPMGLEWYAGARTDVTVSGRTISWTAGLGPITFTYGVY